MSALTRRSLLRAGAVFGAVGAAAAVPPAVAAPAARFADDFARVPDGPLEGRFAPTGHRWHAWGVGSRATMVVGDGVLGAPAGHVPGAGPGGSAAGYASIDLGGPVRRIEAEYRWDASPSTGSALAVGAFDFGGDVGAFPDRGGGASAHLAVSPALLEFAVFSRGVSGDYTVLVPRGAASGTVLFQRRQVRDGRTPYRVRVVLRGDVARVEADGLPAPLFYRDPRIASVPATHPFWEYLSTPGGDDLPRFTRVSAALD